MDYYRSLDASTLDPDFPTIFELLASQQLTQLINPYIRYILVHYAQSHPQYLIKIVNRYDELFLLIFGAVEYAHLRSWNSTFVEKFYGLKRTNRLPVFAPRTRRSAGSHVEPLRRLTRKQVWGSVAFALLVPYIKEKAQVRYERLQGRYAFKDIEEDKPKDDAPLLDHWRYQADIALLNWFPRAVFWGNSLDLVFTAFYLFRGSGPSGIADFVLNMRYSRQSQWDHDFHEEITNRGRFKGIKRTFALFGYVLPATLFTLKFLEWWNSSEFYSRLASAGPELPPPEAGVKDAPTDAATTGTTDVATTTSTTTDTVTGTTTTTKFNQGCFICGKTVPENPAALETGVVYCYKCIWDHLQSLDPVKNPVATCPATGVELLQTTWNKETQQWDIGGIRRLLI